MQDVESHTQDADEQCSPVAQLAVAPHVQAPLEHVRPLVVQSVHDEPPFPHVLSAEVWQVPVVVQHPFGQEEALHAQTPPWHTWPVWHGLPEPHLHRPEVHRSASVVEQATQLPPLPPQLAVEGEVMQVLPAQHPVGQDVESHLQEPDTQCSPEGQRPPAPQEQDPEEQVVPFVVQLMHAAPPLPHVESPLVSHCPLLVQQPLAHDVESHTQAPEMHRCPAAHGALVPHLHWPAVQRSAEGVLPVDAHVVHELPPVPQVAGA